MHGTNLVLVDARGDPLEGPLAQVLQRLAYPLRRDFPDLCDDVELIDVLEEAARRIIARGCAVRRLYRYSWLTVQRIALSRMRHLSHRYVHESLSNGAGRSALRSLQSSWNSPQQIERLVLEREFVAYLTTDENAVVNGRLDGCSSKEIALQRGCTEAAVNAAYHRAIVKLRRHFAEHEASASARPHTKAPRRVDEQRRRAPPREQHTLAAKAVTVGTTRVKPR